MHASTFNTPKPSRKLHTTLISITHTLPPHTPLHTQAVKKKQLLSLLERERSKERRERVATMLTQRFVSKYGLKYEQIVSFFVEAYLSAQDDRSLQTQKQDLSALEKEIRNAIQQKNEEVQRAKQAAKSAQNKQDGGESEGAEKSEAEQIGERPEYLARPPSSKEWELLQVYQIVKDEERDRLKAQERYAEKIRVKNYLDEQIKKRNAGDQTETEDDKRYALQVMKDVDRYHAENERKERERRKRYEDEIKIRDAQIQATKERLERERSEEVSTLSMHISIPTYPYPYTYSYTYTARDGPAQPHPRATSCRERGACAA
ncbi:hypothetical protein EON65_40020 [archaeon]|nr:MAG: hypothetical protein EON65_40020 [archaeon]